MLRFLGKDILVNIPKNQIRETVLYNERIHIKLFNGAHFEIISKKKEKELEKIFMELKVKSKYGNFINMKENN